MKKIGILLLVGGVLGCICALSMDTSVEISYPYGNVFNLPNRVNNLGLMNQQRNYLIISGLISIIGTLFAIFGKDSVSTDSYQDWVAEQEYQKKIAESYKDNSKI